MHKYLLLLSSLSISLSIFGQSHFGLKTNFGISRFYERQDKIKIHPAAQGGFFYESNRGKRSFLGGELLFTQIKREEESIGYPCDDNGVRIDSRMHYYNYDISYLSIPLYYGVNFNKIAVNIGVVPIYRFIYYFKWETETITNGVKSTETLRSKKYKSSIANDFHIGTRAAVAYQLNDRINLEVQYYINSNRLLGADITVYHSDLIDQTTLGIRYALNKQE